MAEDIAQEYVDRDRKRLLVCVAIFSNLLFAVTWRLWLPPLDANWTATACFFPQIPIFASLRSIPPFVDYTLLSATIVFTWLYALTTSKRIERCALIGFAITSTCLVLLNQHRLQPWLYQSAILCIFAAYLPSRSFLPFARLLLISVYFFSALSKIDHTFIHSLGQQFIDVATQPLGKAGDQLSETLRTYLAFLFPAGELVVGLGLCWRKMRLPAIYLAIGLHVSLIAILGPWGLNHHFGVLIWNAQFIAILLVLLYGVDLDASAQHSGARQNQAYYLSWCILLLPLLEPFGLMDHWPSWQLYAPRNSRVSLQIASPTPEILDRIPPALRIHIKGNQASPYRYVDLDAWSLDALNAPIYPQDRFQLGVAIDVARRCDLQMSAIATVESVANRTTGKRKGSRLKGTKTIEAAADGFRLNARPRATH